MKSEAAASVVFVVDDVRSLDCPCEFEGESIGTVIATAGIRYANVTQTHISTPFGPSTRICQFSRARDPAMDARPVAASVGKCVFDVRSNVSAQSSIAEISAVRLFDCHSHSTAFHRPGYCPSVVQTGQS